MALEATHWYKPEDRALMFRMVTVPWTWSVRKMTVELGFRGENEKTKEISKRQDYKSKHRRGINSFLIFLQRFFFHEF